MTPRPNYTAFEVGKFEDSQIQELRIYGDGFIIEARSDSKILDGFLNDFLSWTNKELGLVPFATSKPEKYYESSIVVKSSKDLTTIISIKSDIVADLNRLLKKSDHPMQQFTTTGLVLDCDSLEKGGLKKPFRFLLERRVDTPFAANVFYSQAPLSTEDHLAFLGRIEDLAR